METTVLAASPALLVARGAPGRRFITAAGTRRLATVTLEYFPVGRWYNLLSYFDSASGAFLYHFGNVLTGAAWDGQTLHYIDLDLDLRVTATGVAIVEDVADFRRNARQWRYPVSVWRQALTALRELRTLAAQGAPPFTADPYPIAEARARASQTVWT
ncbi:MAG: DUF402 domain-containing protein [Thermomicrobiales bacterium]